MTNGAGSAVQRSPFNSGPWKTALRAAHVPSSRENGCHALRHYFASAALAGGVDIKALSLYLGHADAGFTLRTYTHLMPAADDRMQAAIDAARVTSHGPMTVQGVVK